MRFEVIAAFVIGLLLPVLETCRRGFGEWAIDFTTMFEDYLGGALLLLAGWATYSGKRWGMLFLVVGWSSVTGMMSISFIDQLEGTIRGTVTEPNSWLVLVVKFLLWAICLVSLILSLRSASRSNSANEG